MNKNCKKWVERFRPDHVKDVIVPAKYRKFFDDIVATGDIPNLFLHGKAGTGKTSMARAIINDLQPVVFEINSSLDGRMDVLKEKLTKFAQTKAPAGKTKVVFLDEFDGCSQAFQAGLRKLIEETALNCAYIMTCNFPTKVIGALQEGRTMEFNFNFPDAEDQKSIREQTLKRVNAVLKFEGVEFDPATIERIVEENGNSIREIYSLLQKYYRIYGKIDNGVFSFSEVDAELIDYIKQGKITEARTFINQKGYTDVDVYKFLFDKFVPCCKKKGSAILIIGQYELAGATSRLPDIQLACCLVSLAGLE